MENQAQTKRILSTAEAAKYLGLSGQEVRRLVDEGYLKRLRGFRKPWKFAVYALEEFLKDSVKC